MVEDDLVGAPDAARNVRRVMSVAKALSWRWAGVWYICTGGGERVSEGVVGECECRRLIEVVTGEASDAAAECDYLGA